MKDEREVDREGEQGGQRKCGPMSACAGIPCRSKACLASHLVCLESVRVEPTGCVLVMQTQLVVIFQLRKPQNLQFR